MHLDAGDPVNRPVRRDEGRLIAFGVFEGAQLDRNPSTV